MNKKKYRTPVFYAFRVCAAQSLLSGSINGNGLIVIPGEQHDPGNAGANLTNVWDDQDANVVLL